LAVENVVLIQLKTAVEVKPEGGRTRTDGGECFVELGKPISVGVVGVRGDADTAVRVGFRGVQQAVVEVVGVGRDLTVCGHSGAVAAWVEGVGNV
jgi:hypothetical protein